MNTCTYCGSTLQGEVLYKHRYVGSDLNMKHFLLSYIECPGCKKLINIDCQLVK